MEYHAELNSETALHEDRREIHDETLGVHTSRREELCSHRKVLVRFGNRRIYCQRSVGRDVCDETTVVV